MNSEEKRILDNMLKRRLEGRDETDSEAEAIAQISALASSVPDDTPMSVDADGTKVAARTIRVWASLHRTPERIQ